MSRTSFGLFLAPYHCPAGQNPTAAYAADLDVLELVDRLGFDEAWVGEHHSCGSELIPDPFLFIAHALHRTRHLRLGTGVVSLPYHNPLWTADRALFLDHLSRGRFLLGVGPGALPTDATMIGIAPEEQREAFEEDVAVLVRLLRGETVSHRTRRYSLVDARSQLAPYGDGLEVAAAAVASPTGARVAARHGLGLLSLGATTRAGFDALARHWDVMEEQGARYGRPPRRDRWRLVGPMHLGETRAQAVEDVRFGLDDWADYTQDVLAAPHFRAGGTTFDERLAWVTETGLGVVGTPDDAIAQIERLQEQSGGFGTYLLMHHEWARPAATTRSYELFARYVVPRFRDSGARLVEAARHARSRHAELDRRHADAIAAATARHAADQLASGSVSGSARAAAT
ncbi:LLM class flavin-dependent oxidoreductase [Pseudonocardia sp. NPDC049154]|uniref:LLM class flavin-dependent oxidoreductase n=1 Tax=Pseudonocardia sp. NPDC049154 TaxID=3155501 RepID=UPI0034053B19